jgi:ubiquinone/menaquinone biosynthesis C-methylase UbiE
MSIPYDPSCFNVRTIDAAKAIILTPADSVTSEQRWTAETPYLVGLINEHLGLQQQHRVLDYGCGIGRISKGLIESSGCSVVGVDTSVNMRALAPAALPSERFFTCAPYGLAMVSDVHHAISIWTLQHVLDLDGAITAIQRQLRSYGKLFVVNALQRFLPTSGGRWVDDGKDLRDQLAARFKEVTYGQLEPFHTTVSTAAHSFYGVYQRRT